MGVTYLLDSHVLLWAVAAPERIPAPIRQEIGEPRNPLLVSAVCAMEIATKTRLGKMPPVGLIESWERTVADIGGQELPLTAPQALMAGSLTWAHRDPFDRQLVAQAILSSAVLVTIDEQICTFPGVRTLTW